MTKQGVINLMASSKTALEWDANCDMVKKECGGYPSFWYAEIIVSGLLDIVKNSWSK